MALALATLAASPSPGTESSNATAGTLRITGDVALLLVLSEDDLRAMHRQTVAVLDEKGVRAVYEGVPVAELLERAGVPLGKRLRGSGLKDYVVVEAADAYGVVFALPEFDPDFTDRVILLADRRDGHPLSAREGPFRIVVPGEKRHARWVRRVTALDIRQAR